jgi:hypothetical protein
MWLGEKNMKKGKRRKDENVKKKVEDKNNREIEAKKLK